MSRVRGLVIVGGGAAGIGAALEARDRGVDAIIVEAMDRLGGRAHSIGWQGHRLDLGCTWLHSAERNSLRVEAERVGFAVERHPTNWFGQFRNLGFSAEEQAAAGHAFERLDERMRTDPPPSDRASDAVEPDEPWNAWLNTISGYINGAPLDRVSIEDWLAYDNAATAQNLRLPGSYGSLVATLGADVEHRLATPVTAISRRADAVQIEAGSGVIEAERVIVTVPTATLHRIRFDPPIEDAIEAADKLPLGVANKLFLALDGAEEFPHGAHMMGNPRSPDTGSYLINPMGVPVIEGFYGGDGARAREGADAFAFAIEEIVALLGSRMRKRLQPIAVSRWAHEPWICGSYSHALPGHARMRAQLAEAGEDRIAFAGEAVSHDDYSTAHGAYDSGRAAVRRLFPSAKGRA